MELKVRSHGLLVVHPIHHQLGELCTFLDVVRLRPSEASCENETDRIADRDVVNWEFCRWSGCFATERLVIGPAPSFFRPGILPETIKIFARGRPELRKVDCLP